MRAEEQHHILVVDDDQGIRDLLSKFLQQHSYRTSTAKNGQEMQQVLNSKCVDLIILDIMMPGDDGLTLCQRLRSSSNIPILMLTAVSEDVDRIVGLEMGADDYLSKPFNPRELLARMKAVLRRSGVSSAASVQTSSQEHACYQFANFSLDKTARQLSSPEGLEISLSTGEYNLLLAFVERPQQVLSRDQLLDVTKNRSAAPFDRSIDIQISRLRNKIEVDPKNPQLIKTVRGGGYVLTIAVTRST
ncbi:MAG: response regulator [Gammaproteobacteria bacterium]|nr:response regulator [Gammaproteobacteria bacterium]